MRYLELKVPPPLVAFVFMMAMFLLSKLTPTFYINVNVVKLLIVLIVALISVILIASVSAFKRANTTINPTAPEKTSQLVTSGLYQYTRNPMYLALCLFLLGVCLFLRNLYCFALIPAFILYMNQFQIKPEERALKTHFGSSYEAYMKRVRRWI